jgi:hypothetical protein
MHAQGKKIEKEANRKFQFKAINKINPRRFTSLQQTSRARDIHITISSHTYTGQATCLFRGNDVSAFLGEIE